MIDMIVDTSCNVGEDAAAFRDIFSPPGQTEWIERAYIYMGYTDTAKVNPVVYEKVHHFSDLVNRQTSPVFLFKSEPLETCSKTGFSSKKLGIKSARWGKTATLMTGSKEVCCFGLTLGERVETTNKELDEKSLIDSFIWDALCSSLAEFYADQAELFLSHHYRKKGLEITRRFSPGYCDLSLEQGQSAIFGFCNLDVIGLRISRFGLMTPRKSITAMVLAAECVSFRVPCHFCKRECRHRRS